MWLGVGVSGRGLPATVGGGKFLQNGHDSLK